MKRTKEFQAQMRIKALQDDDKMSFEGYLSTFGNVDRVGDIVEQGAFDKSLSLKDTASMLFNHDRNLVIGKLKMSVDGKGLKVIGEFDPLDEESVKYYQKIKFGSIDEMSIGMRVKRYEPIDVDNPYDGWLIKEADILEGSIVTIAANQEATIDVVKTLDDQKDLLKEAKEKALKEIEELEKKY